MRTVSTGVGLCVLSGTIAACFVVSHFGGEVRAFAQAAQQAATAAPEANNAALASGCSSQSESWLSPIARRLNRCINPNDTSNPQNFSGRVGCHPVGACDIDSDGVIEFFDSMNDNKRGVIVQGDGDQNGPILLRSIAQSTSSGGTLLIHKPVLSDSTTLISSLQGLATEGYLTNAELFPSGWRDVDQDGDQDLICAVQYNVWQIGRPFSLDVWFENTGYQAPPPPNPYDLDQDGEVGAGDISVLLLNFD